MRHSIDFGFWVRYNDVVSREKQKVIVQFVQYGGAGVKIEPEKMAVKDYLNHQFECECGRKHLAELNIVVIEQNALEKVPVFMREHRYCKAFVISDAITYQIAGEKICRLLEDSGLEYVSYIFTEKRFIPDERALGQLMVSFSTAVDLIIAVGTGSINDLCRFASYKWKIPFMIAATAPPMDGFASSIAALSVNNYKTTFEAHTPQAVIADTDILKNAPVSMIAAGLGDTLGKYTCLCDWKLSHLINGEYYCDRVVAMVYQCVKRAHENVELIADRNEKAVKSIMEALVLTGVAMSFVGNSRPASGCEHHLSHFWETRLQQMGRPPILHGLQVGLGTVLILKAAELLRTKEIDFSFAREKARSYSFEEWKKKIEAVYKDAADGVIELERHAQKHNIQKRLKRIDKIEKEWNRICVILKEDMPSAEEMISILKKFDAPYLPGQKGLDDEMVWQALVYGMEIRERYTILQMAADLGLSEYIADSVLAFIHGISEAEA